MSFQHGKDTVLKLGTDDLSAYTNTSEITQGYDEHDVTAYGASGHAVQGGLFAGKVTFGGTYDSTASVTPRPVITAALGTVVTLIRQPEGTGSGLPQDSVSVLVKTYVETNPVADMITWTCECTMSGVVTDTAQT